MAPHERVCVDENCAGFLLHLFLSFNRFDLGSPVQCCLPMLTSFDHPEQARTRHSCRFHLISIKESVSLALRFVLQPAGIKGTAKKLFGFFHDLRQGGQKGAGTGKEEDTS